MEVEADHPPSRKLPHLRALRSLRADKLNSLDDADAERASKNRTANEASRRHRHNNGHISSFDFVAAVHVAIDVNTAPHDFTTR